MKYNVIESDAVQWARDYKGPKFHALLCDPPYHLTSTTERFGKEGAAPAQYGTDGAFARASKGFMGKVWDGGDVAFNPETWAAFKDILLPGAFGFAYASSRGWHRMAVAIEDAGFVFHPSVFLLGYAYGSGFPKATNISKALDKQAGKEREVIGEQNIPGYARSNVEHGQQARTSDTFPITGGAVTDLARTWESHRYGLQALKPAIEPIIVFQKPYAGRPIENITQSGAGALNIDAGRINGDFRPARELAQPNDNVEYRGNTYVGRVDGSRSLGTSKAVGMTDQGRWPANFVTMHTPECQVVGFQNAPGYTINRWQDDAHPFGGGAGNDYQSSEHGGGLQPIWECVEGCPVKALADQGGIRKSGELLPEHHRGGKSRIGTFDIRERTGEDIQVFGDEGTVDRFFYQAHWALDQSDPFFYTSKPSNDERDAGLENMPLQERFTHGEMAPDESGDSHNTTGQKPAKARNVHPTVKPLSLSKYLGGMLLPPDAYTPRRIFNPFCGSGSEGIGAMMAGWDEITGIDLETEYCEIARARLAYWEKADPETVARILWESWVKGQPAQVEKSEFDGLPLFE